VLSQMPRDDWAVVLTFMETLRRCQASAAEDILVPTPEVATH